MWFIKSPSSFLLRVTSALIHRRALPCPSDELPHPTLPGDPALSFLCMQSSPLPSCGGPLGGCSQLAHHSRMPRSIDPCSDRSLAQGRVSGRSRLGGQRETADLHGTYRQAVEYEGMASRGVMSAFTTSITRLVCVGVWLVTWCRTRDCAVPGAVGLLRVWFDQRRRLGIERRASRVW